MIDFEEAKETFLAEHPELDEHHEITVAFLTIVLLFGAAAEGATRNEKKALYEARLALTNHAPLHEVGRMVFHAKGPDWDVPPATMAAIAGLSKED